MKPRWETFEVSESERFPELQGRRVSDLARERGLQPARRDVRDRGRGGSHDPLSGLHRQRRRRRRRPPPRPRPRRARALRRGRAHRPAVRRAASRPTCSARGCAIAACCRSSTRCASSPASPPTCSASCGAATCARATRPTCASSIRPPWAPGPTRRVPRLPGRRGTPDRGGAHRRPARARERHADPGRRIAARRDRTCVPARVPRSREAHHTACRPRVGDHRRRAAEPARSQSSMLRRHCFVMAASGASTLKPWQPPGYTCSSVGTPAWFSRSA